MTLLEAPWVNGSGETDVTGGTPAWPYPEVEDGYALPLEAPGLGIEFGKANDKGQTDPTRKRPAAAAGLSSSA
jgi:hypothetical protein